MTTRSGWVGISADELDAQLKAINPILIVEGQALELRARPQLDGDHDGRRGALTPRAPGSAARETRAADRADGLVMTNEPTIPPDLLARPWHAVGLAWTAAHAFAACRPSRRPGVHGQLLRGLASVWAALRLVIYLPLVLGLLGSKGLACRDRHALVLVSKPGTPSLVSLGWLAFGATLAVTPVIAASYYFPQAWAPLYVLLGSLFAFEAAAMLYRGRGRGSTRARREELGKAQLLGVT